MVIAVIGAAIYGVNLYSKAVGGSGNQPKETQEDSQEESQSQKETETDSEKDTEKKQTEKQSETQEESESETQEETGASSENEQTQDGQNPESSADGNQTASAETTDAQAQSAGSTGSQTAETIATEAPVPETQPAQTEPPEPVYLSINSACYMRSAPDYGDNIIGQYEAGTTVQFLEDVGGWYRVQVNGVTGYMGARFFN